MNLKKLLGVGSLIVLILILLAGNHQVQAANITDQYIIVLKDNVASPSRVAAEMAQSHSLRIGHIYQQALKGYSAQITPDKVDKVKNDPRVKYVVTDQKVTIAAKGGRKPRLTPTPTPTPILQTVPNGVKRIGVNSLNNGSGITVAVIDTGIDLTHPDLAANIVANTNCWDSTKNGSDDNGHGSHVAGTIAALDNNIGVRGVAPAAKLVAVKVLDSAGSGTFSSVICGVDYVTTYASTYNIKVVNMSLSGGGSSDNNCGLTNNDPLHQAICNSTQAGITYVVSAGNSATNSSYYVPAAYDDTVITVSALADSDGQSGGLGSSTAYGADDTFASYSNYGSMVDLGAPGVDIYSTWKGGGYNYASGTSMASPHVAGAAALYIKSHLGSTWQQVRDGLKASAEILGAGHTDPSGLHPEPVVKTSSL